MLNFLKKLFMRNPKHYIVSGPSVPEKTLQTNATRVNFCFRTVKMATML